MKDKKYIPQPIDTSDVKLSKELEQLADLMSKNVHEVWAETRIMQGWKYGEQRNDELKTHPTRPRILVRQHVKDSISDILSSNDTAYKNVQLFGTFLNGFDESLFDDDLSICVNGIYSDADCSRILLDESNVEQKIKDIPYENKFDEWKKKWSAYEQTPESFKMATRYQTDHYRTLLSIIERAHNHSNEDLKVLIDARASTEHRRWIAERTLAGWRQAKVGEKRIDSLKIHTCITTHSKLPKDELIKDRNVVEFAPVLVEFANRRKKKIDN